MGNSRTLQDVRTTRGVLTLMFNVTFVHNRVGPLADSVRLLVPALPREGEIVEGVTFTDRPMRTTWKVDGVSWKFSAGSTVLEPTVVLS